MVVDNLVTQKGIDLVHLEYSSISSCKVNLLHQYFTHTTSYLVASIYGLWPCDRGSFVKTVCHSVRYILIA